MNRTVARLAAVALAVPAILIGAPPAIDHATPDTTPKVEAAAEAATVTGVRNHYKSTGSLRAVRADGTWVRVQPGNVAAANWPTWNRVCVDVGYQLALSLGPVKIRNGGCADIGFFDSAGRPGYLVTRTT